MENLNVYYKLKFEMGMKIPPLTNIKKLPHCDQNVPAIDQRGIGVPKHHRKSDSFVLKACHKGAVRESPKASAWRARHKRAIRESPKASAWRAPGSRLLGPRQGLTMPLLLLLGDCGPALRRPGGDGRMIGS